MSELLVNKADFELYRPIPESVKWESFVPFVLRVQRGFIRDVLGSALYYDLYNNQALTRNANLLSGTSYTYNGNTIDFFGIKPAIVMYAWAAFIKQNDFRVTPSGNKRKRANQSDNSTPESINDERGKALDEAAGYMQEAVQYLRENRSTYTLWKGLERTPRGGLRVGMVAQPDFYSEDENWRTHYPYGSWLHE